MRKNLLLLAIASLFCISHGMAQVCTPLPIPLPGIYPSPLTTDNLPDGQQGVNYSETVTIVVLADTSLDLSVFFPGLPTVTVAVEYQRVNSVDGLPSGLNFACDISGCEIPGDSSGCVLISGIPDTSGVFEVSMDIDIGFEIPAAIPVIGGTIQELPLFGISWDLEIQSGVGIEELQENRFDVVQNGPNPFRGSTDIHYHVLKPSPVEFTVMDISGHILHQRSARAAAGRNVLTFDATGYAPGIYLYRLSDGERSVTHKMIVVD
ncbi:MAG: T9SS type A sorting domain-containing protein [Bacteroidota bacterium]